MVALVWVTWVKNAVTYHLWWLFSLGTELWISRAVWSALWLFEGKFRHEGLYVFVIKILVAWHPQTFFWLVTQSSPMVRGAGTRDVPLRTSSWETRHQAAHRLLAILAFFPQTESLFTGQGLANFNWRAKANTKETFFPWALLLCFLREEFFTYQTTVSNVGCGFDCLQERAGLIKMEGQPSKC